MITSIIRDVTLLSKLIYYAKNDCPEEIELKYANTQASIFFLATFIGKIYEMWVFITKNNILKELESKTLSTELQKSINSINAFFSNPQKKGIFEFIRHKFSCHYEYRNDIDPIINDAFERFKEKDFQMYLSETGAANDIFPSLNSVILISIFKQMDELGFPKTDDQGKMQKLFILAGEGAKLVMDFCPAYLTEPNAFPITWNQENEIELTVDDISTIKLPIIAVNENT